MPITHWAHSPTQQSSRNPQFVLCIWVSYGLPRSLFLTYFSALPLCSSVVFLKFHIWVKSYGICFSLIDLFLLVPSTLLQMARFHCFWWLSNILFCVCVCVYVYVCVCVCVCVYHIFFIHSSVNRHLGSHHTLAIVDNAAINIGVHMSHWICVFVSFGSILNSRIASSDWPCLDSLRPIVGRGGVSLAQPNVLSIPERGHFPKENWGTVSRQRVWMQCWLKYQMSLGDS